MGEGGSEEVDELSKMDREKSNMRDMKWKREKNGERCMMDGWMDGGASRIVWLRNMKVKVGRSWVKAGAACY